MKQWNQICTFESLLQLQERDEVEGQGWEQNGEREISSAGQRREARPGERLLLSGSCPPSSPTREEQEASEVTGCTSMALEGREGMQGLREVPWGLCGTLIDACLGPNLLVAIELN